MNKNVSSPIVDSIPAVSSSNVPELRKTADLHRVFPSGVRIGKTPYGFGVFSYAFIPAGTPIGRVRGVVVHDEEYSSDYCISAGEGIALEPAPPFCYLNHSCEPNCALMHYVSEEELDGTEVEGALEQTSATISTAELYAEENEENDTLSPDDECSFGDGAADVLEETQNEESMEKENECDDAEIADDSDDERERFFNDEQCGVEIWVETRRDIMPGEELTIDYAWPADRAMKCLCGSNTCRGWIVDPEEVHELNECN